jgi:hypothetical protein
MHLSDDAVVQDGKIVLSHLPFAGGQHVRVIVAENSPEPAKRLSIQDVRQQLKGKVRAFRRSIRADDPQRRLGDA